MHFFQARDRRAFLKHLPSNNKGRHQMFFFVSGEGWEYLSGKEDLVRVQRTWGVPYAWGNASYPFLLFSLVGCYDTT